jgi:hypothetical protein
MFRLTIELHRTSVDGSGRKTRGLQNRLRALRIKGAIDRTDYARASSH